MRNMTIALLAAALASGPAVAEGFHAEVRGGWDNVSASGIDDDGIAYGFALGYDLPVSEKVFVGLEAALEDAGTKKCVADVLVLNDVACIKAGRDISAVARIGYKLSSNTSIYALGGYSNARIRGTYDDGITAVTAAENGDGVRLGAGVQLGLGQNFYTKAEYRYTNYEADFSRNQVLVGFGYQF